MDRTADFENGVDDSGNVDDSNGRAGGVTDGDSATQGNDREAIDYGKLINGATEASREREQERREAGTQTSRRPDSIAPKYTKPPSLDEEDPEPPKRGRKPKARSGEKIPVTVKMCGAVFALIFGIASIVIVGSRALRLEPDEKKELGEALYETIDELPKEHPVVTAISFIAPWARLGDSSIEIVGKRVDFIRTHRVPKNGSPPPRAFTPTQTVETVRNGETVQRVTKPVEQTPNLGNAFVEDEVPPT